MERLNIKKALYGFGAIAGIVAMSGCTNYSGEGNEFRVEGVIVDAGEQSLKAEIYDIDVETGDAEDWFEIGNEHRIHDNCDCHGFWRGRKTYGVVLDYAGVQIEPSEVAEGSCVEFEGSIRTNSEGKYTSERPVFETAQLVSC